MEAEIKPSALDTVRDVIAAHAPFWSCLAVFGKKVPHDLDAFFALENVEDTHVAEDEEELVLNRSFRKMELVPDGGENN